MMTTMAEIDELAVLREFKWSPPSKVEEAIRTLGIQYVEEPMEPGQSGFFARTRNGYRIGVNSDDGPQRRRFTAAHELGHFVLHRDLLETGQHLDRLFDRSRYDNPSAPFSYSHEVQANNFAAEFLMPANMVAQAFRECGGLVDKIAERFRVSRRAAEIRLKTLKLIE
jgi:Zn-dependent peptidase ImmA (M78 family)